MAKRKYMAEVDIQVLDESGSMVSLPPLWMDKGDNFVLLNEKGAPIAKFKVLEIKPCPVEKAT